MAQTMLSRGAPAEVGMSGERLARAAALYRAWTEKPDLRTIVALVARRGCIVLDEAFGPLTADPGSPLVARDSIFPISSLTKLFTATSAMILVEEGRLGLHVPLSWYFPEYKGADKDRVSLFHLLTHTSGMRDEAVEKDGCVVPAEHIAACCAAPLSSRPGAEMVYCNAGINLAGALVERAAGAPLQDFARQRIFEPLGMRNTTFILPEPWLARAALRRTLAQETERYHRWHSTAAWPAGSAWSSAADLAVFGQMFLNGGAYGGAHILAPSTVSAMTRNQIPGVSSEFYGEYFREASWGLGWSVVGTKRSQSFEQDLLSPQTFCHCGAVGLGLWVDPFYKLVAVYLIVSLDRKPWAAGPEGGRHACMGWCPDVFINTVMGTIVAE